MKSLIDAIAEIISDLYQQEFTTDIEGGAKLLNALTDLQEKVKAEQERIIRELRVRAIHCETMVDSEYGGASYGFALTAYIGAIKLIEGEKP